MSFKIKPGVKDIPRLAVAFVLALVPFIFSVTRLWDAVFWYVGLFILTFVTISGKEDGKHKWSWFLMDLILPVIACGFSIYFMQYINLVDHGRISTVDTNALYVVMYVTDPFRVVLELLVVTGVYFLLRACQVSRRFSAAFTPLPFLLIGLIDYFVYNARGHEVLASDLYSVKTAMNVAGTFEFPLFYPLIFVAMPYALYFIACLRIKNEPRIIPWYARIAVMLALCMAVEGSFIFILDNYSKTHTPQGWMDKGSIYNGLLINLCLSAHSLRQSAPEGYNHEYLDDLITEYGIDPNDPGKVNDDSANIIVILSESYMQLRDYLPMLGVYEDPSPYWNGLKENTIHGYVTASVYGGNTPNSEFEFFTGLTTGFLPTGSIPYTMFIDRDTYSLVWALDNLGYKTTAMHCYLASGWQRPRVYPLLGFQNMKFIEDFKYDDSDLLREYVSDKAAYRNLIEEVTSAGSQKTLTFLATMQNHGGYSDAYDNLPVTEYVQRSFAGDTFQVNTYINLVKESDKALEYLLTTLSEQDEKYCVVIFGDHQPALSGFTNNMAPGKNSSWCVPYLIWTNYDMDQDLYDQYSSGREYTSLNYLALDVLRAANIDYPAYYQILDHQRKEIPVISAIGYYSIANDKFFYNETPNSDSEAQSLNAIRSFQYALMFDDTDGSFETGLHTMIDRNKTK